MNPNDVTIELLRSIRDHVASLGTRQDETNARLDQTNLRLETINLEFNARLDQTNQRLDQTNQRLDGVVERLDGVSERLERQGDRLDIVVQEQIRQSTTMAAMSASVDRLSDRIDNELLGPMGDAVRSYGWRLDRIERHLHLTPEP